MRNNTSDLVFATNCLRRTGFRTRRPIKSGMIDEVIAIIDSPPAHGGNFFKSQLISNPLPMEKLLNFKQNQYKNIHHIRVIAMRWRSTYRTSRLGLSHWNPYAMRRGGCLELYYCNMVEWSWWDSSLICKTNWLPSVLWHCWNWSYYL